MKGYTPRPGTGTIAALCTSFLQSHGFRQHSISYQGILRRHCMGIEGRAGAACAKDLQARHITADMAALAPSVALGNSWAVNVATWVGERINEIDTWESK